MSSLRFMPRSLNTHFSICLIKLRVLNSLYLTMVSEASWKLFFLPFRLCVHFAIIFPPLCFPSIWSFCQDLVQNKEFSSSLEHLYWYSPQATLFCFSTETSFYSPSGLLVHPHPYLDPVCFSRSSNSGKGVFSAPAFPRETCFSRSLESFAFGVQVCTVFFADRNPGLWTYIQGPLLLCTYDLQIAYSYCFHHLKIDCGLFLGVGWGSKEEHLCRVKWYMSVIPVIEDRDRGIMSLNQLGLRSYIVSQTV